MSNKGLTQKERVFAEEYVRTGEGITAYIKAGYARLKDSALEHNKASAIKARPHVKAYIQQMREKRSDRVGLTQDIVLRRLWGIASADPNDLVAVKVTNCRFCWGKEFKYQYTDHELTAREMEADRLDIEQPDEEGGGGFDAGRPPHPDCPNCGGIGKSKIMIADTTNLKGSARLLYAGAEQTRNGIKVKMHDQLAALVKVADHMGMFEPASMEALRQANLKKIQAEAEQIGKEVLPVSVNIQVVDASNPNRERGSNGSTDSTDS